MPSFLDLPRELRDMVYDFYFLGILHECRTSRRHFAMILRTNRQTAVEAAKVRLPCLQRSPTIESDHMLTDP